MKSYHIMWDDKIKKIISSYAECRKIYIDDVDIMDSFMKEKLSKDHYHIYSFNQDVDYIIKDIRMENNQIQNMIIFLLSNDRLELAKAYCMLKDDIHLGIKALSHMYTYQKEPSLEYFLDDSVGIIKNYERCVKDKNFMLSDIHFLNQMSPLELKNGYYYIKNHKYLKKEDYDHYVSKYFDEISRGLIEKQLYVILRHIGSYQSMDKTYSKLIRLIKEENKKIIGLPMEQFVCGRWNVDDENKYITNIMIPIEN